MSSSPDLPSLASKQSKRRDSQTLKTNSLELTSSPLPLSVSSTTALSHFSFFFLISSYINVKTFISGLLFPICYIGDGIFRGDIHGAGAAAPHLFLLSGQAFTEPIGFSDKFSTPIGILGPVFYNARRIFALLDWVKAEFSDTQRPGGPVRLYGGRAIALVNTVMWFYNLFGLLLPVFLPRSCEIYFSGDNKG